MTDIANQRLNMVESQVRPSDVTDRRILRAMSEIPREAFVPESHKQMAYMDELIPLTKSEQGSEPRALLAPRTLAKLIQLAEVSASDVVLDVGCGSGYSAALLGKLAETVVALEKDASLAETATKALQELSLDNVAVVTSDLPDGYSDEGPYDAIFVGGRVEEIPAGLLDQLKDGGRLVAISGPAMYARAVLWQRVGANFDEKEYFEAGAPILPGFAKAAEFIF